MLDFDNAELVRIDKILQGDVIFFEDCWQTASYTTIQHFKHCYEFSPVFYSKESEKVKRASVI